MNIKGNQLLGVTLMIILLLLMTSTVGAVDKESAGAEKSEQSKQQFSDVDSSNNNALYINYLANRKIISGYPDGSYHPKEALTRAQAAVILAKAAGLDSTEAQETRFSDVKTDHWAAASIAAAAQAGYLKGYPDGSYHPDEALTRAQGISLIMRLSSQKDREALPALKDMSQDHWAAADMATALAAGMIGLSADGQAYPEKPMNRGSLARALGTLLTKDPGLYTMNLAGTIKDLKGDIKLTREETTTLLQNDTPIYKGDTITSGANSTATIMYPDGSSILIKENTELNIKESTGRACIKKDGQSGTAVENVEVDLKKGTLFGALATKQENQENQQARIDTPLVASLEGLKYIATAETPPWYQEAQTKKVKMKVDMPWGVAAIRGTFILVSVNQDGSCNVSCLTGDAQVEGQSGNTVPLSQGQSSGVVQGGAATDPTPMSEKEKQEFSAVQQWVVNTALQIDINKEATAPPVVEMIVEIPDQPITPTQPEEQVKNTIEVVLNALEASGIELTQEVKDKLQEQLQQILETNPTPADVIPDPGPDPGNESGVSYINYAMAGTYGPATAEASQTIAKNVIVSAAGTTLQNMIITRDLTLAAGIGDGSVTLKNVKVQGNTYILGGGPNSITLEDSELYTVTIDNQTNTVRIVAKGNTSIGALTLNSGARLEESELSGSGFSTITTGPGIPSGATIILSGNFSTVNIARPGLTIQVEGGSIQQINISSTAGGTNLIMAAGASVNTLQVDAQTEISGTGQIMNAVINAEGVEMQQAPLNWTTMTGVTVTIGGESQTGSSSSNAKLSGISLSSGVLSPVFSSSTYNYTASVANSVYEVTVAAIPQESTATVQVNGVSKANNTHLLNMDVGSNAIEILVTAQDGNSQGYNLTITRAASSACQITSVINPPGASISGTSITASVANSVTSVDVDVEVSPNATWSLYSDSSCVSELVYKQVTLDVGNNQSYILVTAQNGDSQKYDLTINRAASATKAITAFNFNELSPAVSGSINEGVKTIALTVPYGTNVTALVPTITHIGASVSPASGVAQNFSSPVTYIVTAADGSYQSYTVTATVALNSACSISNVINPSGASISGTDITASVATDVTSVAVDVEVSSNATWSLYSDSSCQNSITGNTISLDTGASTAYILVTAQTGDNQVYNLTIYREAPLMTSPENYSSPSAGTAVGTSKISSLSLIDGAYQWQVKVGDGAFAVPALDSVDNDAGAYTAESNITVSAGQHVLLLACDAAGQVKGYADIIIDSSMIAVQEERLFNNWNGEGIASSPPNPTNFTINTPYAISYIDTYHNNASNGAVPGNISLQSQDGTVYGPWDTYGISESTVTGRSGCYLIWVMNKKVTGQNEPYTSSPGIVAPGSQYPVIPAGTYSVIDSSPSTWSYNSGSINAGFAQVKGYAVASAPTPLTAVAISGTAVVGDQLTAEYTPADATASYQWRSCDTVDGDYSDISGATASTYTLVQADAGKFIQVVATGTGSYGGSVTSAATASVTMLINSLEDLYAVSNNLSGQYTLMQDLDFTESTSYSSGSVNTGWISGGAGWTPIGGFTGIFDGNGHTISNLYINSASSNLGLFSSISGTVKNLGLLNVSITGTGGSYVGAFAGSDSGLITNCYSTGTISSTGDFVGGISGRNDDGAITACSSSVAVLGCNNVGGISGKGGLNYSVPLIQDCYSTGSVTGTNYVGGLLGYGPTARIVRSYAAGAVQGMNGVGGLAGYYDDGGYPLLTYLENSYALNPAVTLISGSATTIGRIAGTGSSANISGCFGNQNMSIPSSNSGINGTDITLENAKLIASYSAWGDNIDTISGSSTDSIWVIDEGNSFPSLRGGLQFTAGGTGVTFETNMLAEGSTGTKEWNYICIDNGAETGPNYLTITVNDGVINSGNNLGINSYINQVTCDPAYVAMRLKTDMDANPTLSAAYEVSDTAAGSGTVSIIAKEAWADRNVTMQISNYSGEFGVLVTNNFATEQCAGVPGVHQVNQLTITHGAVYDGYLQLTFNDGSINVVKTITVATGETPATIATACYNALAGQIEGYTISNPSDGVVEFYNNSLEGYLEVQITII